MHTKTTTFTTLFIFFILLWPNMAASLDALHIDQEGDVGLGTNSPDGSLHVKRTGHVINYFQSADNNAVQLRFRTDSGNRRFLAVNSANVPETQMLFDKDKIQFSGQTSTSDLWATIDATGLTTTGAGACSPGPCDLVFNPNEYQIESIEEHAAYMWKNQHLWGVGPTKEGEPINLTKKTTGILHELEKAHIYIDQLHTRLKETEIENGILLERLEIVESKLGLNKQVIGLNKR